MSNQVEDYEKLEDFNVHHSGALNGLFKEGDISFVVNLFEDGYTVHFGSNTDPIETLDTFNSLFPIRNSLHVLEEDQDFEDGDSLREHEGHAYHMYPSDEWRMVTTKKDAFGLSWRDETSYVTNNFDHTVAVLANEENHDLGEESYEPVKEGIPLFYDELSQNSEVVEELYEFCKKRPKDFLH